MTMALYPSEKNGNAKLLCSVCIANYNGETYLKQCLDSILAQDDFQGRIEIIVHDDASTDGSVAFIQSRYPQVRLLTSTENVGFCVSNNRMADVAQGTFILLLNNDAVLHKDAIKILYTASQKYGDGIFGLPQYNAETGELIDIGSLFDPFLNPIPNKDTSRKDVGMIIGACLWLSKKLWDKLGGFPEWFGSLAEDMYICCLVRLWGYPVKALPESGFDHWVGRSLGGGKITRNNKLSTTTTRRALSERNKTFVMLVCYPLPVLLLLFPLHLFLFCLEGFLLSLIKWDRQLWFKIYWNCLKELWLYKPLFMKKRRNVQKEKQYSLSFYFSPFQIMPYKLQMLLKYGLPHVQS